MNSYIGFMLVKSECNVLKSLYKQECLSVEGRLPSLLPSCDLGIEPITLNLTLT